MSVVRGMPIAPAAAIRLPRERNDAAASAVEAASPQQVFEAAHAAGRSEGIEQGRKEGWRQGHEEGLAAGRQEAARELELRTTEAVAQAVATLHEQQARLAGIADRLAAMHDRVFDAAEDDLIALAYEMVTRMVAGVAVQPDAVCAALQSALARASRQPRVLLCVHPEDAALLDVHGLRAGVDQVVAWRADEQVALGGCLLESPAGALDLRLETLLADCRATLLRARGERAPAPPGAPPP